MVLKNRLYCNLFNEMKIGNNSECMNCKTTEKNLQNPIHTWLIGDEFEQSSLRILIVTKTAINDDSWTEKYNINKEILCGLSDLNETAIWLLKYKRRSPTLRRISKIAKAIHNDPDNCYNRIAWTNLIKCNSGTTQDTTSDAMADSCLNIQGFIWKEIELLRPTHILFLTGTKYDSYIGNEFKNKMDKYIYSSEKYGIMDHKMNVWEFTVKNKINGDCFKCVRTWHPQNRKKGMTDYFYVQSLVDWIRTTENEIK